MKQNLSEAFTRSSDLLVGGLGGLAGRNYSLGHVHGQVKAPNSVWLPYQLSAIAFFRSANRANRLCDLR